MNQFLRDSPFCDTAHPAIQAVVSRERERHEQARERAIAFFALVRDTILYEFGRWGVSASTTLAARAGMFLNVAAAHEKRPARTLRSDAVRALERYRWPGNVRELENEMQRAIVSTTAGECVTSAVLSAHIRRVDDTLISPTRPLKEVVRSVEVATVLGRLREHGYHRAAAAESLGMTREGLWHKLRQLGLTLPRRTG